MTFGWQGFALEHPDDWAPVHLTGNRSEGYVRIASSTRLACQLRWKSTESPGDLTGRLKGYLERLERDAKKAKKPFDADIEQENGKLVYRYSGFTFGRGSIFQLDKRVFFLELISPKNESMLSLYRKIVESFHTESRDRWALLGLNVLLPKELRVVKTVLEAGHTSLELSRRGISVKAERWGFGEQLIEKHGLLDWAKAIMKKRNSSAIEECCGVRLESRGIVPTTMLVARQKEQNQLIVLSVQTRKKEWRPSWDWID